MWRKYLQFPAWLEHLVKTTVSNSETHNGMEWTATHKVGLTLVLAVLKIKRNKKEMTGLEPPGNV